MVAADSAKTLSNKLHGVISRNRNVKILWCQAISRQTMCNNKKGFETIYIRKMCSHDGSGDRQYGGKR